MAFTKKTWQCEETITADDLNRLEDGVEEALECCGGGSTDVGYSCEEMFALLTEETVTTVLDEGATGAIAVLSYNSQISASAIRVTFDGVVYDCNAVEDDGCMVYGAPFDIDYHYDWSECPFAVWSCVDVDGGNEVLASSEGTHTIKIEIAETSVETAECFQKAVQSVPLDKFIVEFSENEDGTWTASHTYAEIVEAYEVGKQIEGYRYEKADGAEFNRLYYLQLVNNQQCLFAGVENLTTSPNNSITLGAYMVDSLNNIDRGYVTVDNRSR